MRKRKVWRVIRTVYPRSKVKRQNDKQWLTQKTEDWATQPLKKPWVNSGAPEGLSKGNVHYWSLKRTLTTKWPLTSDIGQQLIRIDQGFILEYSPGED